MVGPHFITHATPAHSLILDISRAHPAPFSSPVYLRWTELTDHSSAMHSNDHDFAVYSRSTKLIEVFGMCMAAFLFMIVCHFASFLTIATTVGEHFRMIGRAFGHFERLLEDSATPRSLDALRPVLTAIGNGVRNFQRAETGRRSRE
ncbi:uncharacterized protein LOC119588142 [Penaeus monodon]|uniref:uncharacterized protein LOC119588142 n=1 Tax=Penaeus monodon TaxID=6687 RepID=UPI0018A74100|nr:uncharacterized protein LOC119588142 [Penaeus monodon]